MKRFGTEGAAPVAAEEACGESAGDGGVRKRARAAVPPQTVRVYARAGTHVTSVATDVLICARFFGDFARRQSDSICATCCEYAGTFLSSFPERFFW